MIELFTKEFSRLFFERPEGETQTEKSRARPFLTVKQVLNRRSEAAAVCFDISFKCEVFRC
jgi:hypothetical protein